MTRGSFRTGTLVVPLILLGLPLLAQESPSFQLKEHTFNAGGTPVDGAVLSSSSFRVSLSAIGDGVSGGTPRNASYRIDDGFVTLGRPSGEVRGLRFSDSQTLQWIPEGSIGSYNLYRDRISNLSGLAYGQCVLPDILEESAVDDSAPDVGEGLFYLVTANNRLNQEGTKGFASDGAERGNEATCP